MENASGFLQQYATSEVTTVFTALLVAFLGYKAGAKAVPLLKGLFGKINFAGLSALSLMTLGLGGIGFGIGELSCLSEANQDILRETRRSEIMSIAIREGVYVDKNNRTWVLQQTPENSTDGQEKKPDMKIQEDLAFCNDNQPTIQRYNPVLSTPTASTIVGLSIASIVGSIGVMCVKYG